MKNKIDNGIEMSEYIEDAEWNEEDHPRGNETNAGQFAKKGSAQMWKEHDERFAQRQSDEELKSIVISGLKKAASGYTRDYESREKERLMQDAKFRKLPAKRRKAIVQQYAKQSIDNAIGTLVDEQWGGMDSFMESVGMLSKGRKIGDSTVAKMLEPSTVDEMKRRVQERKQAMEKSAQEIYARERTEQEEQEAPPKKEEPEQKPSKQGKEPEESKEQETPEPAKPQKKESEIERAKLDKMVADYQQRFTADIDGLEYLHENYDKVVEIIQDKLYKEYKEIEEDDVKKTGNAAGLADKLKRRKEQALEEAYATVEDDIMQYWGDHENLGDAIEALALDDDVSPQSIAKMLDINSHEAYAKKVSVINKRKQQAEKQIEAQKKVVAKAEANEAKQAEKERREAERAEREKKRAEERAKKEAERKEKEEKKKKDKEEKEEKSGKTKEEVLESKYGDWKPTSFGQLILGVIAQSFEKRLMNEYRQANRRRKALGLKPFEWNDYSRRTGLTWLWDKSNGKKKDYQPPEQKPEPEAETEPETKPQPKPEDTDDSEKDKRSYEQMVKDINKSVKEREREARRRKISAIKNAVVDAIKEGGAKQAQEIAETIVELKKMMLRQGSDDDYEEEYEEYEPEEYEEEEYEPDDDYEEEDYESEEKPMTRKQRRNQMIYNAADAIKRGAGNAKEQLERLRDAMIGKYWDDDDDVIDLNETEG